MILALNSLLALASGLLSLSGGACLAYVGPAGIGALGILLVVVVVLLIGAFGLVLYPLRLILGRRRRLRQEAESAAHSSPLETRDVEKGI
jgi:hypothetical protein